MGTKFISVAEQMPPIGKKLLFRCVCTYRKLSPITYVYDQLDKEVDLEYCHTAINLTSNYETVVSQHHDIESLCDWYVSHWAEIPLELQLLDNGGEWIEFENNKQLFNKVVNPNTYLKFEDGSISQYGDEHPLSIMTHFLIDKK